MNVSDWSRAPTNAPIRFAPIASSLCSAVASDRMKIRPLNNIGQVVRPPTTRAFTAGDRKANVARSTKYRHTQTPTTATYAHTKFAVGNRAANQLANSAIARTPETMTALTCHVLPSTTDALF